MRKLILLALLTLLPAAAHAQADLNPGFSKKFTCYAVQVSSMTRSPMGQATAVVTSSAPVGARWLSIQNQDGTSNAYCGDTVYVSTPILTGFDPDLGHKVPAAKYESPWQTWIVPGQALYCVNDSLTGRITLSVCAGW